MVTIVASYTIVPNQPTPNDYLWLANCDQAGRLAHTATIYIYKQKCSHNIFEIMRTSLGKILEYYYPVAGRLCLTESGRMELVCNAKGVTLLEAESTKTLGDYGDFSPSEFTKELVPHIDSTQPIEELPLLLVQLTRFHGDEGFAIGVLFSHPLVDGFSAIQFINSWAKVARGETLEPDEMPFLDRTKLNFPHPSSTPHFDHPELKPLALKLGCSDSMAEKKKRTISVLLKLTSKQVEILKKKANDGSMEEGLKPYSRYEVIAAHVWSCASKARKLDKNQPTVVHITADIRSRLIPALPKNYFGNALARIVTSEAYVGEIVSNPLNYGAQKVREAIKMLTNDYIRSQLNATLGQKELDNIKAFFLGQGEHIHAQFRGNPNIQIMSWMSMPVYEADFGWGKPIYFGPAHVFPFDKVTIVPGPPEDGSVIVCAHFQIAHMELFKKFFYEDI